MKSTGAGNNAQGQKYIYLALAGEPFVASNGTQQQDNYDKSKRLSKYNIRWFYSR